MIKNNKLFFLTYSKFNESLLSNEIKDDAIVFIKDKHLIWTHGEVFDCNTSINRSEYQELINSLSEKVNTSELVQMLANKADLSDLPTQDIANIRSDIQDLLELVESINTTIGADISHISLKFVEINEFLNSLEDGQLETIVQTMADETQRAEAAEQVLLNQINTLEERLRNINNIKHVILTQENYDALSTYDPNTIYFITELEVGPASDKWVFGNQFPITFADKWEFGDPLPITFIDMWTFGRTFPIILN